MPHLVQIFAPSSVVDVGCGNGGWLAMFAELGIEDTLGMDGAWVDPDSLLIPPERFRSIDLTKMNPTDRQFDMCLCLEVAEHLPDAHAASLVAYLTGLAPVVVFSAAVPGQSGVGHVNERWQSYWAGHFARSDYVPLDCIRPLVWDSEEAQWWYAQNLIVYVAKALLDRRTDLSDLAVRSIGGLLDVVHPKLWAIGAAAIDAHEASWIRFLLRRMRRRARQLLRKP